MNDRWIARRRGALRTMNDHWSVIVRTAAPPSEYLRIRTQFVIRERSLRDGLSNISVGNVRYSLLHYATAILTGIA